MDQRAVEILVDEFVGRIGAARRVDEIGAHRKATSDGQVTCESAVDPDSHVRRIRERMRCAGRKVCAPNILCIHERDKAGVTAW